MARSSFCMSSILLLSIIILASASGYEYEKKPEGNEKLDLNSKPDYKEQIVKPEEKENLPYQYDGQSSKAEGKDKLVDLHAKLVYEKPKSEENERYVFDKPNYDKQNTDEDEKILYNKLPNYEQLKPEEKEKVIPSKEDYEKSKPDYKKPKTEGNEKILYNKLPNYEQLKPDEKEKLIPSKGDYEKSKPDNENPKTEGNEKIIYNKLPNYEQLKPEEKQKLIPSKGDYEKPKSEEKEKLHITYPEYEQLKPDEEKEKTLPSKPVYGEPKPEEKENFVPTKPNYEEKKYEVPSTIGVQGLVYCKTDLKYSPLPGAVAKVTCLAVDEESYKTTQFSVLSKPCDSKGYFYATISSPKYQWKIKDCKAYLNYSPLETCKVPVNINNGVSGDLLASNYKILNHYNNMKLYSVGPFFYTSPAQTYDKPPVNNANSGY